MSLSAVKMTPKLLQQICRSLDLYQTPELNDKLYLHYKGFTHIAHLQPYSGLKVLYLEGNALTSLGGLEAQCELRCLYVQENSLDSLDSLCPLPVLSTLNANTNFISSLPTGWSLAARLPQLHTLSLQNNRIASVEALHSLSGHPTVAVLDLQHNRIGSHTDSQQQLESSVADAQFESLLALLASLPQLRVLYLAGNPLIAALSNYRKRTLAALTQLTYLDERPVFEEERRMVTAWTVNGVEGEREEKGRMRREEKEKEKRQWELFDRLVKDAASVKEHKEQHDAADQANTDSLRESEPSERQTQQVSGTVHLSSSEWEEEKQQLSAAAVDGLMLKEGQRVGQASGRNSAMHAWQSSSLDGKQAGELLTTTKLEMGAKGTASTARQGMLIEVIDDDIDM